MRNSIVASMRKLFADRAEKSTKASKTSKAAKGKRAKASKASKGKSAKRKREDGDKPTHKSGKPKLASWLKARPGGCA